MTFQEMNEENFINDASEPAVPNEEEIYAGGKFHGISLNEIAENKTAIKLLLNDFHKLRIQYSEKKDENSSLKSDLKEAENTRFNALIATWIVSIISPISAVLINYATSPTGWTVGNISILTIITLLLPVHQTVTFLWNRKKRKV